MATLTSGDTISLRDIVSSSFWGQVDGQINNFSLGQIKTQLDLQGDTVNSISMSAAGIDSFTGITGYTYIVEGTSETYEPIINGGGYITDFFNKVGYNGGFHTAWIEESNNYFSGNTTETRTNNGLRMYTVAFGEGQGANDGNADGVLDTIKAATVKMRYLDGVNHHATGYNTVKTKSIYWVDSYDGNSTALCLTLDTPITLDNGDIILAGDVEEGMKLKGVSVNGITNENSDSYLEYSSPTLDVDDNSVEVIDVIFSFTTRIYNFNNGLIKCTSEHPFMVLDSNNLYKFKRAHLIEEGDSFVQLIDGEYITTEILSKEVVEDDVEIVSIDVDGSNIYFANNIITHNKEGNSHTDFDGPTQPTTVSYTRPTLSWSGGTADSDSTAGITGYDIQIGTNNGGSYGTTVLSIEDWNSTSIQLWDGVYDSDGPGGTGPLSKNTQYHARVRNVQSGLKSAWTYYPTTANFFVI